MNGRSMSQPPECSVTDARGDSAAAGDGVMNTAISVILN